MSRSKKNKLEDLKSEFKKYKVLMIEDLFKVLETASRSTVNRYMKEFEYLTSYTHKGRYYTLQQIAKFDEHGLWHHNDIGFSNYGSLFDTITYLVERSEAGMTGRELKTESHTEVKYALLDLVKKEKLSRLKSNKTFVYLSSNPSKAQKQTQCRENITADQAIDDEISFRVLLTAYKFIKATPSPEEVANHLRNQGSKISLKVVQKVFQRYGLEKKT